MNTSPTLVTPVLGVASATSLATSAASPLLLTNGQLTTIALTSQTIGATTLTIPDFASVSDTFVFNTKAATLSNKTFVAPALGTPASGVATNLTGTAAGLTAGNVTTNANLTGPITSVGNATSIAAQTGTGTTFVMNTSPTLVTPILGVASATSLTTSGQGALQIGPYNTGAGNTGEGRFLELLANGTNYTGFKSPDTLAGNVIYTLPSADGTDGQVLSTNGAGVLSWTTKTEGRSEDFKGLSLRTSPNADVAATTVTLDHADEIVMDTGNRVTGWDDLSAVITTAGAG